MSAYSSSKYHIGINSVGYILSQRGGKKYYQKKVAPTFVNKFGGGDASYRDASFWQYFVQTNWRNGSKQLKWDDPGKFWKSENVDTSQLEQLTISRSLVSCGQLASGIKVNAMESLRASAVSAFGDGGDSTYSSGGNATDAPIDSACTGTAGTSSLTATNASFAAAQKILIHQTRGTGVGNYELNTISSYTAGTITTGTTLANTYATGAQVLVMLEYTTFLQNSGHTLTAKAWNGTVGGIIAFYASTSATITGSVVASGKGFLGHVQGAGFAGKQGEGSAGAGGTNSRAANGNGGGGGNGGASGDGAGGGGGGDAAAGTTGTNEAGSVGGTGGEATGAASLSTMTFGGGGGSGGTNSGSTQTGGSGGDGGGIVFVVAKTLIVTGGISANATNGVSVSGGNTNSGGGGGGAGGSILIKSQTATLGSGLVLASAGSGGTSGDGGAGGAGAVGRIHLSYASSYTGTSTPTLDTSVDTSLSDVPASITATLYAGGSDGKVYQHTAPTTWTEVFDSRKLTWFDDSTTKDADKNVGDVSGTETAQSQGFQITAAQTVKAISVYIKKNTGTPGDITVRIETDSTNTPSGTLANANAAGTITAFTTTSYGWVTCTFATAFALSASTTYHLVLKTAAAGNDNYYSWGVDSSSPSYTGGAMSASTDGGTTWGAVAGSDALFRLLGNAAEVYCMKTSSLASGGTNTLYVGVGDVNSVTNGDARLYQSTNGTTWTLNRSFVTSIDSCVLSIEESTENSKVYIGVGPQARVYETTDFSTYTVSKRITVPQNPGYPYAIKEYNALMYVGGGSPEQVPTAYYQGFVQYYDSTKWRKLYDYDFTVLKSMEYYDSYLFMGGYHGHLHVFTSTSLDPLFSFKDDYEYQVQIYAQKYFDDKLYLGLYPQEGSGETNVGIWRFDRHGLVNSHHASGVTGYRCFTVTNGTLYVGTGDNGYVYKISDTNYETEGYYQSSYFDANLPSIPKLYNAIIVRHDPLATGQSIVVYYRFKESDSWTTLGTSSTVAATEKTLSFAAGTTSNKITLKVKLVTTTTTATPKLTEVVMQYSLYPDKKWQWTMRLMAKKSLQLLDRTTEGTSATTLRSGLEALMNTETLYTFTDIDETSYNVLVTSVDQTSWVVNKDDVNEDEIFITLLEA